MHIAIPHFSDADPKSPWLFLRAWKDWEHKETEVGEMPVPRQKGSLSEDDGTCESV